MIGFRAPVRHLTAAHAMVHHVKSAVKQGTVKFDIPNRRPSASQRQPMSADSRAVLLMFARRFVIGAFRCQRSGRPPLYMYVCMQSGYHDEQDVRCAAARWCWRWRCGL
jgi:hypothetical protein